MDTLKILTVGNSFTDSLCRYFQPVAESAGCRLIFDRANFGGCELERHWSYIEAEEHSEICRIYKNGGTKLRDLLAKGNWDIVSIQQASHDSWKPGTFHPWAKLLTEYIKTHAPGAETVIQQTWAYRADHPAFPPVNAWGITREQMYERLTENYIRLGRELNLRIVPTGLAVELSRQNGRVRFSNYDPALPATLSWPDLPPQAGDVVGQMSWGKNRETGELEIRRDLIHLNERGQYLQACVWFAFLYRRRTAEIAFVPEELADGDAAFLRETAQAAVDSFQQVRI